MRSAQRCLDAKSFRHYANDAYTPYEILHVIGFDRDHFLPSNERGREADGREVDWEKLQMEYTGDGGGTQQLPECRGRREEGPLSAFIFLCFGEKMFLIFDEAAGEKDPRREIDYQRG